MWVVFSKQWNWLFSRADLEDTDMVLNHSPLPKEDTGWGLSWECAQNSGLLESIEASGSAWSGTNVELLMGWLWFTGYLLIESLCDSYMFYYHNYCSPYYYDFLIWEKSAFLLWNSNYNQRKLCGCHPTNSVSLQPLSQLSEESLMVHLGDLNVRNEF